MKNMGKYFILLLLFVFLSGCSPDTNASEVDVFQYKNAYVGDNSAVGNILMNLHGSEHYNGFQLHTTEEPYGITANYGMTASELNKEEIVFNNASYLFALIQNADWVTFRFEMVNGAEEYTISRDILQAEYEMDLREIDDEDELKQLIEEFLEYETKMDGLFS